MKNWYIEITWSIEGSPRGGWQETTQTTKIMRGTAQKVLEWLTAELARGKPAQASPGSSPMQPLAFRAMPFEISPYRKVVALIEGITE
jgi:hypothetical protein